MDADQFDRLARMWTIGGTRRRVLAAVTVMMPAGLAEKVGWARKSRKPRKKKKCKPRCKACKTCKKGKCRSSRNGTRCSGGTCFNGVCFGGSGKCTESPEGAVSLVTETTVNGQTLRATQTSQPLGEQGETAGNLDLTLGGDPLLTIETEGAGGSVTVTVTYGNAFGGIRRSRFTNDGQTVTGEIDGRAIQPLPTNGNPNQVQFADGGPPPTIDIDPDLARALDALIKQVHRAASDCDPARHARQYAVSPRLEKAATRRRKSKSGASRRNRVALHPEPREHPEDDFECLAHYALCNYDYNECVSGAAGGCALALFGYGICVAIALGVCILKAEDCRRGKRHNAPCCPVRCGGDPENSLFGSDPSCCEEDEACLDPRSNQSGCCPRGATPCGGQNCCRADETCSPDGSCCGAGSVLCGGVCCPNAGCLGGECCEAPNGVCGGQCCPPFSTCCGGQCCNGSCVGGSCCEPPARQCGNTCCDGQCCNGRCCPANQGCDPVNGLCVVRCGQFQRTCESLPGMPTCCLFDEECCQNGSCCPPGTECCFRGGWICSPNGCVQ